MIVELTRLVNQYFVDPAKKHPILTCILSPFLIIALLTFLILVVLFSSTLLTAWTEVILTVLITTYRVFFSSSSSASSWNDRFDIDLVGIALIRYLVLWNYNWHWPHMTELRRGIFSILHLLTIGYVVSTRFYNNLSSPSTSQQTTSSSSSSSSSSSYYPSLFLFFTIVLLICEHWVPSSRSSLIAAEDRLIATSSIPSRIVREDKAGISYWRVAEEDGSKDKEKPILVLVHGYAGAKGFYIRNLIGLSQHFTVYSIDLFAFGLSSHTPPFPTSTSINDPSIAVDYFNSAFHSWVTAMDFPPFILLGHSFGGYLSAAYALSYPSSLSSVILASPVGIPVPSPAPLSYSHLPLVRQLVYHIWDFGLNPGSVFHFMGPIGERVAKWIVKWRFGHAFIDVGSDENDESKRSVAEVDALGSYLYHANAGPGEGLSALNRIVRPGAHARDPLGPKLVGNLQTSVLFIFGDSDWMFDGKINEIVKDIEKRGGKAKLKILNNVGHQLYIENVDGFNDIIIGFAADKKVERKREKVLN